MKSIHSVKYPVVKGNIDDLELMQIMIEYSIYNKIYFDSFKDCSILLAEPLNCGMEEKELLGQFLFEKFSFDNIFLVKPAVLTLFGEGKYTGLVTELNEDFSNFVPIYNGFIIDHAKIKSDIGRTNVIEYMENLLIKEYNLANNNSKSLIENIVNNTCYMALDFEREINNVSPYEYWLPDGKKIEIKNPRIMAPEILINPNIYINSRYNDTNNIVYFINHSIEQCDADIRQELYSNIYLTGVNSKYKGLKERMQKELTNVVEMSEKDSIRVSYSENGIKKCFETFFFDKNYYDMWIKREEYYEFGKDIFHRKSF